MAKGDDQYSANEDRVLGDMDTMSRNCNMDSCEGAAVAALAEQDLCINHFLCMCYENLEQLDPRGRKTGLEDFDPEATKKFVEECSRQALDVSLQCPDINNLQRGRLLDILLWAGELFVVMRTSPVGFTDSIFPSGRQEYKRWAAQP